MQTPISLPDSKLKEILMFKQFTKIASKPKDGDPADSDEEFERIEQAKQKALEEAAARMKKPERPLTPELIDSDSDTDLLKPKKNVKKVERIEEEPDEYQRERVLSSDQIMP
jgi:hypothetical protein